MSDNSIVNFDFQPVADVANNLLDKIGTAVGWVIQPKGNRENLKEAELFLKNKIMDDENIPPIVKAALISKARTLIKGYLNQREIVQEAMNYLSEEAKPEVIDDEWLRYFLDNCKCIEDKEAKKLWGKILAGECEQKGSISRALLHSLTVMDNDCAKKFETLCKFAVNLTETNRQLSIDVPLIFIWDERDYDYIYQRYGLHVTNVYELETCGLIHINEKGFIREYDCREKVHIKYGNYSYFGRMKKGDKLFIGSVMLTRAGIELIQFIDVSPITEFEIYLREIFGG